MLGDDVGVTHGYGILCDGLVDPVAQACQPHAMTAPFCIIGTPRSRTAWFARFLSHGAVICEHEPSVQFTSLDDMRAYFRPDKAASDSMLTLKWPALHEMGVRLYAVVRPRQEVLESAMAAGLASAHAVRVLDKIYRALECLPNEIPRCRYGALTIRTCAEIFEWCHGEAPPAAWLYQWYPTTVEADYSGVAARAHRNAAGLKSFYHELVEAE